MLRAQFPCARIITFFFFVCLCPVSLAFIDPPLGVSATLFLLSLTVSSKKLFFIVQIFQHLLQFWKGYVNEQPM